MKTRIATAISVVGVLGAGSAAALVNTQILDAGPAESSASAAVLPPASTIDVEIPEVPDETIPTESSVPTTLSDTASTIPASTVPESTVPPAPAPTGFLTAFNVGDAGVVTVDVIDGQIVLVSAEPKAGWTITEATDDSDDNEVEVEFRSSTVRVEFEATFVDGQIVPKVSSKSIGGTSGAAGTPPLSGTVPNNTLADTGHDDDDDGHDDDGDDDHESEHEDDEDEDEDEDRDDEHDDEHDDEDEHDDDDEDEDEDRDDD